MIRTQVYLPEALYNDIKRQARLNGQPAAQLIRDTLQHDLKTMQPVKPVRKGMGYLAKQLNITGGPSDLSRKIDDYLYGNL